MVRPFPGAIKRLGIAHWSVIFNAGTLVSANVLNLGLGVVYWWLAARWFAPSALGLASAAISAMSLLGMLGMLGLGTLLIGELPRRTGRVAELVASALAASGLAGLLLGLGFSTLAPVFSHQFAPLRAGPLTVVVFSLGVSLTSLSLVLDQAAIGLLRGSVQLWRNGLFSLIKLLALIVAGLYVAGGGMTVYGTWVVGYFGCLLALLPLSGGLRLLRWPRLGILRVLGWTAVAHHMLNVALQISGLAMPLVVTIVLSTTANAYFYTASMVASLVFIAPIALATVFYAVGGSQPEAICTRLRFTLGISLAVTVLANLVLLVLAGPVMSIFGHTYAQNGAVPLQLFALSSIPLCVREFYAAIKRLQGQTAGAAPLVLFGSGLKLLLGAWFASMNGLVGLCIGALIATCVEAALMAPTVLRRMISTAAPHEASQARDHGAVPSAYGGK